MGRALNIYMNKKDIQAVSNDFAPRALEVRERQQDMSREISHLGGIRDRKSCQSFPVCPAGIDCSLLWMQGQAGLPVDTKH